MKKIKIKREKIGCLAQSTLEYAMVIACIVAALLSMQIYIKRSFQGKLKAAADEVGEQYSAKTTTSSLTQTISNPRPINVTGTPRFISVINPRTGREEKREIMEVTRDESMRIDITGSERTGRLSDETLF